MKKTRTERNKKSPFFNGKLLAGLAFVIAIVAVVGYFAYSKESKKTEPVQQPVQQQVTTPQGNSKVAEQVEPQEQVKEKVPTPEIDETGYAILTSEVTEPTIIDGVMIANKKYPLPATYNPGEDPKALEAYKKMEQAAKKVGFTITAFSGFRSYEYQQQLYDKYVARDGKEAADRYSARPGHSEHQTGLAFDIGEVGRQDLWLTEEFGQTPAGLWLAENAHKYGFILRYPKGKEEITGFMYESWHFRYLGEELAKKVHESGETLEEYLNID